MGLYLGCVAAWLSIVSMWVERAYHVTACISSLAMHLGSALVVRLVPRASALFVLDLCVIPAWFLRARTFTILNIIKIVQCKVYVPISALLIKDIRITQLF